MSDTQKKWQTQGETTYRNVRLIADPDPAQMPVYANGKATGETKPAIRCAFIKETRNKKARDHRVEVTVDVSKRTRLKTLKKGDVIAVLEGFEDITLFESNSKFAFNGVGVSTKIYNPRVFEPGVDLRGREGAAPPAASEGVPASAEGATGGGEGGGNFFDYEP